MKEQFALFLKDVGEENQEFVEELNDFLISNNYKCDMKESKSGLVVSYISKETKKTILNYVFRKSGIKIRMYLNNISKYENVLNTLPDNMKKEIEKSSPCKRLIKPDDCNPRCLMGFSFSLDNVFYQKCRYMAFMISLNEENNPYLKQLIELEVANS